MCIHTMAPFLRKDFWSQFRRALFIRKTLASTYVNISGKIFG
jgi:hypothetical protein